MYLNCHSYYSLRHGTLSPTELVTEAAALGHKVLILTDINNTSASFEFLQACAKAGVRAVGLEYRQPIGISIRHRQNAEGWRELGLLTDSSLRRALGYSSAAEHCYIVHRSLPKTLEDLHRMNIMG
jgi:DNA polymerase-3 subunit alpha